MGAAFDSIDVGSITVRGKKASDDLSLSGKSDLVTLITDNAGGGGITPSHIFIGDVDFASTSGMDDFVAFDTQVSTSGADFSWAIGDPTVINVLSAGLYYFEAAASPVGSYPAVGMRRVSIVNAAGDFGATAAGTPVYPTNTQPLPIPHSRILRLTAGSVMQATFLQTSGESWAGETFLLWGIRVG